MAKKKPGDAPFPSSRTLRPAYGEVLSKLKSFYDFMLRYDLDHLEIEEAGFKLGMSRKKAQAKAFIPMPGAGTAIPQHQDASSGGMTSVQAPAPQDVPAGSTAIKAAMMGIFYRAASPSSPPFIKDGDSAKAGQVICMIEAMKVFNEIKADFPCRIVKALVENGKPVKSGQNLFLVERL